MRFNWKMAAALGGFALGSALVVRRVFAADNLPWWHGMWSPWRGKAAGGDAATASAKLQSLGLGTVSDLEYALARGIQSEVGDGSDEEKVCLAELVVNRAHKLGVSVMSLLVGNDGAFDHVGNGRFVSTFAVPNVDAVLIARFVLSGQSENYARGANDEMGYDLWSSSASLIQKVVDDVQAAAAQGKKWIGHIPGVDPWHLYLQADSGVGLPGMLDVLRGGRTVWTGSAVGYKPSTRSLAAGGLFLAGVALLVTL